MMGEQFDATSLLSLLVALAIAITHFRLIRANRRKVLAEGSDLSTQAADRMLTHWEKDNERLRERVELLEQNEERMEARIAQLEQLLREHGVSVPPLT